MRKILSLLLVVVALLNSAQAQIVNPVKWTWKAESLSKNEYKLVFTAKLEKGWHTYSQFIGEGGPIPTTVVFDYKKDQVELIGKTTERGGIKHDEHDPVFDMQLIFFDEQLILEQKVKVLKGGKVRGVLTAMACDDTHCTAPEDTEFEFTLKADGSVENTEGAIEQPTPFDSIVEAVITENLTTDSSTTAESKFGAPLADCGDGLQTEDQSLWSIIILGFLGGLVALITPCVFPMIPLTVSFFTKRSESKTKGKFEAFFYAFSIVFIYFLLAVPFLLFNISPDTLNEISTGAALNIFFFVIFLIFAFSFFGFYEITLPAFIANKADSASNVGGLVGIFFMALTLAIVSFSCTGPIIGSLLVGALSSANGKMNLVAGMTSFGFALALPFGLFALFPSMMKSLPKSGGWLNSVKVLLGFVELIFAVKFLSNADLVAHWGIVKREVFLGLWVLFGLGLFAYLIGKLKFPHDSPIKKLSLVRIGAALLALLFTLYSAWGIPGNDLKLFSGFPPPKFYSLAKQESECPNQLNCFHNDYEGGLAYAKKVNKPILIDFTGWACVNCRRMEEKVWTDPSVYQIINDEYVLISLYVDDKKELPENEQYVSTFSGKKIKTIGNKFSDFEASQFNNNTQPLYVLLSPDEKLLTAPKGYTPNVVEYTNYLNCGISANKNWQKK